MTIFPKTKLVAVALMTLLSASCMRETPELPKASTVADRITFGVDLPFSADVDTKATEVTSLSSFNASAVTGSAGSETAVWTNAAFSDGDSDSKYTGDKYWPLTNDNPYRFYASNATLAYSAAGNTVTVDTDTDVVCAYLDSPTYKDVNTLAFDHVFARIGDMTVNAASGYTITGVSIRITPKVSGTYNLRTGSGQTDGTGWSETSDGSVVELANATPGTKSNNVFLVPGRYTLTASWTATRGEYTQTFTDRNQDVDIVGGSVSSIITTLGGLAQDLQFSVSVNAWGSNGIVEEFPLVDPANGHEYVDLGLETVTKRSPKRYGRPNKVQANPDAFR